VKTYGKLTPGLVISCMTSAEANRTKGHGKGPIGPCIRRGGRRGKGFLDRELRVHEAATVPQGLANGLPRPVFLSDRPKGCSRTTGLSCCRSGFREERLGLVGNRHLNNPAESSFVNVRGFP